MSEEIFNFVRDEISSLIPGVEENRLTLETNLKNDLGIDSLRIVELLVKLEDRCNVLFEESDLSPDEISNVGDVVGLLGKYVE